MKAYHWEEKDAGVGRMTYYWMSKGKGANILSDLHLAMLLHSGWADKGGPKLLPQNSSLGLQPTSLNFWYSEKYQKAKVSGKKCYLVFKERLPSPQVIYISFFNLLSLENPGMPL